MTHSLSPGTTISETRPMNFVGRDNSPISGGPSLSLSSFPFLPHEIMMMSSRSTLGSSSNDEVAGTRVRTGWQFSAEAPGGRFNGRDALSPADERDILDYMLIDPYMSLYGESHDIYRDMRLDINNMSYEKLLALEETIENVSSGVSRTKIRGSMRQWKYASPDLKFCCICQENYAAGDDAEKLNCGYEFHTGCIEQWLVVKNVCPICKVTARSGHILQNHS